MNLVAHLFGRIALALGIFLLSLFVLIFGVVQLKKARASADWPSVTGKVVASSVDRSLSHDSQERAQKTRYHLNVDYEYEVGGQTYMSSRFSHAGAPNYGTLASARTKLAAYPVGRELTVFYDPERPDSSVLQRGAAGGNYFAILAGLLFMILGPLVALFGKARRGPRIRFR